MPPAMRVLCVDDEETNNLVFKATFSKKFDIVTCTSGVAALASIPAFAPHVIVTDLRMPGMGGIELLERVREISPLTRRLMITAFDDPEVKKHNGSGVCGCIEQHFFKPFDRAEVERALAGVGFIARVDEACAGVKAFVEGVDRTIEKFERYRRGHAI